MADHGAFQTSLTLLARHKFRSSFVPHRRGQRSRTIQKKGIPMTTTVATTAIERDSRLEQLAVPLARRSRSPGPHDQRQACALARARRQLHRRARVPRAAVVFARRRMGRYGRGAHRRPRPSDRRPREQRVAEKVSEQRRPGRVRPVRGCHQAGIISDMDAMIVDTRRRDRRPRRDRPHEPGHRHRHQGGHREGPLVPLLSPRFVSLALVAPTSSGRRGPCAFGEKGKGGLSSARWPQPIRPICG